MGACASKRSTTSRLEEAERRYDILASLFATRAQDLSNLVNDYEASRKAEEMAFEEAAELREQLDELRAKNLALEREHENDVMEWQEKLSRRDEEILAYQRVVEMRMVERDQACNELSMLKKSLPHHHRQGNFDIDT